MESEISADERADLELCSRVPFPGCRLIEARCFAVQRNAPNAVEVRPAQRHTALFSTQRSFLLWCVPVVAS